MSQFAETRAQKLTIDVSSLEEAFGNLQVNALAQIATEKAHNVDASLRERIYESGMSPSCLRLQHYAAGDSCQSVDLAHCRGLRFLQTKTVHLGSLPESLQILEIGHSHVYTKHELTQLCRELPHLKALTLGNINTICRSERTDEVTASADFLPSLERLVAASDEALSFLVARRGRLPPFICLDDYSMLDCNLSWAQLAQLGVHVIRFRETTLFLRGFISLRAAEDAIDALEKTVCPPNAAAWRDVDHYNFLCSDVESAQRCVNASQESDVALEDQLFLLDVTNRVAHRSYDIPAFMDKTRKLTEKLIAAEVREMTSGYWSCRSDDFDDDATYDPEDIQDAEEFQVREDIQDPEDIQDWEEIYDPDEYKTLLLLAAHDYRNVPVNW